MGRRKLGNLVFARRVTPEMWGRLDALSKKGVDPLVVPGPKNGEVEELKSQVKALLEDVERLTKELEKANGKAERVARMSESELVQAWIRKYDALLAKMPKGEWNQEAS